MHIMPSDNSMVPLILAQAIGPIPTFTKAGFVLFPLANPRFEELPPFPANSNPFHHDSYSMGATITSAKDDGRELIAMFVNNGREYITIHDTASGRRFKITFMEKVWCEDGVDFYSNFERRYGVYPEHYEAWQHQQDVTTKG